MVLEMIEVVKTYAVDVVIGIIILLVGFSAGILAKKLLQRLLKEVELNKIMNRVNVSYDLEKWISSIISYVIYLITIVYFLRHLGITSIVLYLIVGAILMLLILTFLVGLKDVIPNFIGWIFIQKNKRIQEDRKIDINEISGKVEKIGYLETEIKTDSDDILYVPNALFLKSKFRIKKE